MNIKNFNDFLLENKSSFQKFYMLVRKEAYTKPINSITKLTKKIREKLFNTIEVDISNYQSLKFDKNVPILNFTQDNLVIQKLLETKQISKKNLYNDPAASEIASDKVIFHDVFKKSKYLPKTVFSKKDASKLKFPIIAKPAKGHSAKGIQMIDSNEDLEKSKEHFDLFSEKIDIATEYRCLCFRNKILFLNERIKKKGAKDFLKKVDSSTEFIYADKDFRDYKYLDELNKMIEKARELVYLDFYSIDFAEDKNGNLFMIEMNSRTGMGGEKCIDLYLEIYKDFYGKISFKDKEELEKLKSQWIYEYEKGNKLNECTTVAGFVDDSFFLFKNRDRSFTPENKIVHEKIDGVEVAYYTDQSNWIEGMNEYGVGIVFALLSNTHQKGYSAAWTISDEPKNIIDIEDSPFKKQMIKMLKCKTSKEALSILEKGDKEDNPGSYFIGDKAEIYDVEISKGKLKTEKLSFKDKAYSVSTNHGILIPSAGHQDKGDSIKRASSTLRKHQAELQLQGVSRVKDVPVRLKFQMYDKESSLNTFRTDREEFTISQCLMDLTNLELHFFHDNNTADSFTKADKLKDSKIKIVYDN